MSKTKAAWASLVYNLRGLLMDTLLAWAMEVAPPEDQAALAGALLPFLEQQQEKLANG
jgi:hypothetical protein